MAGFYQPFVLKINQIPIIVYPCLGLEKVISRNDSSSITNHLQKLYTKNSTILNLGQFHIAILWDEGTDDENAASSDVMSDIWMFDKIETWGAGPLIDVKIFRNTELDMAIGITTGDGLIILGREEEQRRKSESIEEYLALNRSDFQYDILLPDNFFTNPASL